MDSSEQFLDSYQDSHSGEYKLNWSMVDISSGRTGNRLGEDLGDAMKSPLGLSVACAPFRSECERWTSLTVQLCPRAEETFDVELEVGAE